MMAQPLSREQIAGRAARDIGDRWHVNLGIGLPELCAKYVPSDRTVIYHSENGVLGFSSNPAVIDYDLVNAGKKPVGILPGASFFDHSDSFAMIRGGHIDLAILGAFEVSETGDLANWRVGSTGVPAVGGAMDLVVGAKRVFVLTDHVAKDGSPKLVERCRYPLTGVGVVKRIYTNLAVIDVEPMGFVLREKIPGMTVEDIQALTGARLHFKPVAPVLDIELF